MVLTILDEQKKRWRGIVLIFLVQEIALPTKDIVPLLTTMGAETLSGSGWTISITAQTPDLAVDQPVPLREIEKPFSPVFNLSVKSRKSACPAASTCGTDLPRLPGFAGHSPYSPIWWRRVSETLPFYLRGVASTSNAVFFGNQREANHPVVPAPCWPVVVGIDAPGTRAQQNHPGARIAHLSGCHGHGGENSGGQGQKNQGGSPARRPNQRLQQR